MAHDAPNFKLRSDWAQSMAHDAPDDEHTDRDVHGDADVNADDEDSDNNTPFSADTAGTIRMLLHNTSDGTPRELRLRVSVCNNKKTKTYMCCELAETNTYIYTYTYKLNKT